MHLNRDQDDAQEQYAAQQAYDCYDDGGVRVWIPARTRSDALVEFRRVLWTASVFLADAHHEIQGSVAPLHVVAPLFFRTAVAQKLVATRFQEA